MASLQSYELSVFRVGRPKRTFTCFFRLLAVTLIVWHPELLFLLFKVEVIVDALVLLELLLLAPRETDPEMER